MKFNIYTANCSGNSKNCIYPNCIEIDNDADMESAIAFDHTCTSFKNGRRNISNFLSSNVVVMDCDNDHSNKADEWITPDLIDAYFPDVQYVLVPSRNNNKKKGTLEPRPRFHVYFPIAETSNAKAYANIKKAIQKQYTFFDENAVDAARFIFGNPAEVVWHEGELQITDYLININKSGEIYEGSRNSTLSHFAGKVIKRFGDTDKAYSLFMEKADKCYPPLDAEELDTIWKSAQRFGRKISKQEGYVSPADYNNDFEDENTYKPFDYSDIGQALMLSEKFTSKLRYSPSTDWLVYNGSYWDESSTKAQKVAQELTKMQLEEAEEEVDEAIEKLKNNGIWELMRTYSKKKLEGLLSKEQRVLYEKYEQAMEYRKFVMIRRNSGYLVTALKEARPMMEINVSELDENPYYLNTPKGTYNLKSGEMKEHDPYDFQTKQTSVEPSSDGKKIWDDTLNTFFCNDQELIDYVQEIVGLIAIGKVFYEALIIAYGQGKNGKSTFWNTIAKVLGTYSGHISADTLTTTCKRNVKYEMGEIKGKRLVIASEMEDGQRLSTSMVKQLCSTDDIYAEKKFRDPFSFEPSHSTVLYTNHLPKVSESDSGTWRRFIVIPFEATISGKSDIKNFADFLYTNAGGSILQWIIDGAQKVIEHNFNPNIPEKVQAAIDHYHDDNDWMKHFLEDCCEVDKTYTEKSSDLYQEYRNYCARTGDHFRNNASFYKALENYGFKKRRTHSARMIDGLRLLDDFIK